MQRCDPHTRERVHDRQQDVCWLCGQRRRLDMHRRQQGSLGGSYRIENVVGVCRLHHNLIHDKVFESLSKGWLVESYEDPARVPVWTVQGWVLLNPDGSVTRSRLAESETAD